MPGIGQQVREAVTQSAKEIAPAWRRSIVQNFNAGGRPSWLPRKRSGGGKTLIGKARLMNSISVTPESTGDGVTLVARTNNIIYARIHQYGGTIVPSRAKALAIPLTPEAEKRSPKDWPKGQLFRVKSTLCTKGKGKGEVVAQYALVKKVVIVKREYIRFQVEDRELAGQIIRRNMSQLFDADRLQSYFKGIGKR